MSVKYISKIKMEDIQMFVTECLLLHANHFNKKNKYGCHNLIIDKQDDNFKIWFSNLYPMAPCGSITFNDFDLIFDLAFPMRDIIQQNVTSYFRYYMLNIWFKDNEEYKSLLIDKLIEEKESIKLKYKNNPKKLYEALNQLLIEETYLFGNTISEILYKKNIQKNSIKLNPNNKTIIQPQPQ